MSQVHFGSDPADIQIWINPEIPDQALAEFALSDSSCFEQFRL